VNSEPAVQCGFWTFSGAHCIMEELSFSSENALLNHSAKPEQTTIVVSFYALVIDCLS
jgi:hypothetical protein